MTTEEIFLMLGIIASIPFIFHFINFTGKEIIEGEAEKEIQIDEILFPRYKPGQIISVSYKKGRLNKSIKIKGYGIP